MLRLTAVPACHFMQILKLDALVLQIVSFYVSQFSFNLIFCSSCVLCVVNFSWLAFEGQDFTNTMYVLEMGNYSDLRAMGCVSESSSILSLQPAGFVSSLLCLMLLILKHLPLFGGDRLFL